MSRGSGPGCVPDSVKAHPLGMLAMWAWTLLGFSLAVPAFGGDPKPWPDILWPALLDPSDSAESAAVSVLAVAMILSGLSFLISQWCMNGLRRWPWFVRHNSLWLSLFIVGYVIFGIFVKVLSDPEHVVWWWPLSLFSWLVTGFFISLATKRSLLIASDGQSYPERNGGGRR